jgi:excisionase family DNA binding protein
MMLITMQLRMVHLVLGANMQTVTTLVHNRRPLLTRRQAAEYLQIKEKTLAQWASNKRYGLPYVRVGRRAMYRLSDLDAFIESNVVGGETLQ